MADKILSAYLGLNLNNITSQIKPGQLTYALNANIQSLDGNAITYTNDYSNQLCVQFPSGFEVIGFRNIIEENEIIFFLVNTVTRESEIGIVKNYKCNNLTTENVELNCNCIQGKKLESTVEEIAPCCTYEKLINADCLKFNINYPVRITYKLTNCGYRLYFTDNNEDIRYIDRYNPKGVDGCYKPNDNLDCADLKLFKEFCSPFIQVSSIESNGNIPAGVYQACIAYCDINGNEFTDYFNKTNPVPIYDRNITVDTNYITNKSVKFKIEHNTDVFDYYKIVIIQTVNEVSNYFEAGIEKVTPITYFTYTGNNKTLNPISLEKVLIGKPLYQKANLIDVSSNHLLLADLKGDPDYNFQPFVGKLKLFWETIAVPYNEKNNYSNPIVSSRFRTYMRDEVYPFGIRFKLKTGKYTKVYALVGRPPITISTPNTSGYTPDYINIFPDDEIISKDNKDNIQDIDCNDPEDSVRWKVYNTGFSLGNIPSVTNPKDKICDIYPLEQGEFSYWESTETYPCDERIWGDLAGKPIRHFKLPDSTITHIHDKWNDTQSGEYNIDHESFIYPIGVRLDDLTFNSLLSDSSTNKIYNPETKANDLFIGDLICGFEIVRGNRVGNKSIIAKGIMYDVGKFTDSFSNKDHYFPNYPYNDLNSDSFLANSESIYDSSDLQNDQNFYLDAFGQDIRLQGNTRYTFHSPDIHFQKPQLGTELKLETEEFGVCRGHFVQVDKHPKYKFLTKLDSLLAVSIGTFASTTYSQGSESVAEPPANIGGKDKGSWDVNPAELISISNTVRDTIEKLIPLRNFAYQYNSIGVYNNYDKIPNDTVNQWKRRKVDLGRYLSPNNQNIQDDKPVNNFQRESCVYLKTNDSFKRYNRDEFSRYSLSEAGNKPLLTNYNEWCKYPNHEKDSKIRSFYSSIKRSVPDQYSTIQNISWVSTGYAVTLENGIFNQTYYPIFGGDTFINKFALKRKMPFFVQNMVNRPDQIDFDYNLVPNVAYPLYYIGTSPDELRLREAIDNASIALITGGLLTHAIATGLASFVGTAVKAANLIASGLIIAGLANIYKDILDGFIPKNNLDCDNTPDNFSPTLKDLSNLPQNTLFYQSGKFYLAAYGIPQFFVESDVNTEFRHGRNELEENYYPNVSGGIPDDWLQESKVPILHDNKYNYNATYSLQNYQEYLESFNNYNFDKICQSDFPNRLIYSEKSNNEENFDNFLKFGASNYFDFDKNLGKIIAIDSLDNNKILVRFENGVQIFNTRITLQSNSPSEVAISNSGMFTQDPIEFAKTNTGYGGSQNISFEKTPVGYFWTNQKIGKWYRFNNQIEEISRPNYNWFKEHLPFKILEDFSTYNIDNNFKDIGLIQCWDERFERLFLTKKDYKLRADKKGQVFLVENSFVRYELDLAYPVSVEDGEYFENKSFTVSWSPLIENQISFHSFLPKYYISLPTHFQSGISNSLWNHNISNLSYQVYYNTLYPYIIEYGISDVPKAEICKSVTINNDILKYINETDYYSLKSVNKENYNIFFNKAIIYNKEQCSGLLTLTEKPINDLSSRLSYPRYNQNNIEILYSKYDKVCTFNSFYDITKNYNNGQPVFSTDWNKISPEYPIDKSINISDVNYRNNMKKVLIKSNQCFVRLINDVHQRYKFINQFTIIQNQ